MLDREMVARTEGDIVTMIVHVFKGNRFVLWLLEPEGFRWNLERENYSKREHYIKC